MKDNPTVLVLSLCLMVAVGIIVGQLAGFLSWAGGASVPHAVMRGGAACGGVLALGIAVIAAL
ncbi:hypothetical protein [Nocardia sp. XZ_19_385]|uniref:hypothetical protein n=1 Tax=Nocardia sp. XZ_19_385 TaxID=2769488 RepID=UPI00188EC8E5|nr:hypothetical protein [Nocardia sp. XZ_19_385]